ncbi:MAG: ACT domain-containing protein [Oscillospiraceae bacterium]|nr:ACT domain-containing protein [Oscillospiraceae bacterium]
MAIKQLSVFVENKPAALNKLVKILADTGVNLRAMSIADTKDFGILRVIVDDAEKAKAALSEETIVSVTDVVAVEMADETGSLSKILDVLGSENINLEYMYAFTASKEFGAYVVLRVDDIELAEKCLNNAFIKTLSELDI